MATKYFIQPRFPDTGDNHWGSSPNWSLNSGGSWPGTAGVPTANDNVIIDANSFDLSSITPPLDFNAAININDFSDCKDLTISTGYGCNVIVTNAFLRIHGILTLNGSPTTDIIHINHANASQRTFRVLGGFGVIRGVIAKNLKGVGGKRVYYDPTLNTVTDTEFWLPCNQVLVDPINNIYQTVCGPITRHIQTAFQLQAMNDHPDDDYILDNSIDLLGFPWVPIGTYDNPFTGTLNGQNHTIKNLFYDDGTNENYAGLFGVCGSASSPDSLVYNIYEGVTVHDLKLDNFILKGQYACGALCGFFDNMQATNVHVNNVNVFANDGFFSKFAFGGMGGDTYGGGLIPSTFTNCSVNNVTISGSALEGVGGFCGSMTVDFGYLPTDNVYVTTNCYAKNVNLLGVNATGCTQFGGFAGFCEGVFEKCFSQGKITNVNSRGGGFAGWVDWTVLKDCYSHVNIVGDTGSSNAIGGFVGYLVHMIVSITNCRASGTVTGDANSFDIGGFAGSVIFNTSLDELTILNCYSTGLVTTTGTSIGGFVGTITTVGTPGVFSISNCAWWIGAYAHAIGTAYDASNDKSLTDEGYGTDEADKTTFYLKTHPVYAQV